MSCIRPVNNSEPEFERVATLHRRQHPYLPSHLTFIPTANSSPKLRLNFDDQDSLMTDTDFEGIMHHYREEDNVDEEQGYDIDDYYRQSVLLPPTPGLNAPRPVFVTTSTDMNADDNPQIESSNAGTKATNPDVPAYLQQGIARLGLAPEHTTETTASWVPPNIIGTNACWASDLRFRNDGLDDVFLTPPTKRVVVVGSGEYQPRIGNEAKEQGNDKGKGKEKSRPTRINVIPRVGTLTALPGAKVVDAGDGGIPKDEARPGPSTSRNASTLMPPPKTPITPLSAPAAPGDRKRKLSLSAPLTSIKRILTPSGGMRKQSITHLTHEATAGNRSGDGGAGSIEGANYDDETLNTPTPRRDLTPVFTGPYVTYIDPSTPAEATASTLGPKQSTPRTIATSLFRPLHRHTASASSSTGKAKAPSGKQSLNNMIIELRGQVSNLTIENRVLNDQIAVIRKDWHDTARELDLARYESWNHEMKAFNRGIRIEELLVENRALTVENGALKRGSMI